MLTDHWTLHFLELPKRARSTLQEQTPLIRWLAFLKAQTKADREVLVKGDPIKEKAFNALEFLSHDEQTRQRYEAPQKALHDYATAIETAKRDGERKGTEDMIRRMASAGLPIEQTAAITDRSIADITAFQQRMP